MNGEKSKPIFVLQTYEDRLAENDFSQKTTDRISLSNQSHGKYLPLDQQNKSSVPPPPPLPKDEIDNANFNVERSNVNVEQKNTANVKKIKPKAPPVPVKTSTLSFHQPPPCPTPDYDTVSLSSTSSLQKSNGYASKPSQHIDYVEMESMDSVRFNGTSLAKPRPPSTYFNKPPLTASLSANSIGNNATLTKQRPVSVTIGEYPTGTIRKQPSRFDFLQNGRKEASTSPTQTITSQFASELAQTLNRSNLRRKTESMENLLNIPLIKPQSNGSIRISLNNHLARNLAKSTNDLTSESDAFSTRITININQNDKKLEAPNGILKNGNSTCPPTSHKPLCQQKSITFGEMPTVINEQSPQVS